MGRPRTGTIQRKGGVLRVRVTVTTTLGPQRIWLKLNPELSDEAARAWTTKFGKLAGNRVFGVNDLKPLRRPRGTFKDQPLPSGLKEIKPMAVPGVYVVQANGYYVKIGRAQNISERLRSMQTASPVPLRLLAIPSRNPDDEKSFHQRLKKSHVRGEWFRMDEQVVNFIREVTR